MVHWQRRKDRYCHQSDTSHWFHRDFVLASHLFKFWYTDQLRLLTVSCAMSHVLVVWAWLVSLSHLYNDRLGFWRWAGFLCGLELSSWHTFLIEALYQLYQRRICQMKILGSSYFWRIRGAYPHIETEPVSSQSLSASLHLLPKESMSHYGRGCRRWARCNS